MGKQGKAAPVFFLSSVYSHDATADFGTSPQNPILLPNVPMEYSYLDSLYFDDGEDVVYTRTATCSTDTGHTMDKYEIRRPGSEEVVCCLYFDGYAENAKPNVPKGFYLKFRDTIIRHKEQNVSGQHTSNGKGCLVPLILITAIVLAVGTAVARSTIF